jgi:hypothetical protein
VRARDLELALDARIAGLALQMQVQPHSAGIKKLAALERFYNGSCTPERKGAYENCALSADAHLEWARARQAVFVFLAGADKASAPPQWDNLKGTLKQVPWAVQTLVEFSPLEIRGTYWPVLLQAVAHVQQWLEAGEFRLPEAANAPALSRQLLESQILLRLLQARTPEPPLLRECRPSSLLVSPPRKLSQDAVERLLALAGRWEEEWMEHPAELMVLGQLYALAAAALVQARRLREAARLFTAAYDCRPDVEMVLIQQVRQGRLPATPLMFKLCLGRAPAEVFPQERAQRRKRVALFLRERQTAAPPR